MGMLQEFKDFAMKGNVVDLAVGVVIGGAFGKIVSTLVEKIISPLMGALTGGVDFSKRTMKLEVPGLKELNLPEPEIGWGAFLQATIDFIIIAFALFMVVKLINSMKKAEAAAPAAPPEDITLLREIRDALKK